MVHNSRWKDFERFVSKALQGYRIPRGANFSRSLPDVVSNASLTIAKTKGLIYAECKYSIDNFWVRLMEPFYDGKLLVLPRKEDHLILFELRDIHLLSNPDGYLNGTKIIRSIPDYINRHLDQSREYIKIVRSDPITQASIQAITGLSPSLPILPIVVLGQKSKAFRLSYTSTTDLYNFHLLQNDKDSRLFQGL